MGPKLRKSKEKYTEYIGNDDKERLQHYLEERRKSEGIAIQKTEGIIPID